jgi:hypothetical protein
MWEEKIRQDGNERQKRNEEARDKTKEKNESGKTTVLRCLPHNTVILKFTFISHLL